MMADRQDGPRPKDPGSIVAFRRGVPYENWKAIEMEILKALSNPVYGFSGLEYLVLMNLVLHQPYEDPANLSVGDLARITGQDRANMRKLVLALEGRKVIGRDADASRIWINPKVAEWAPMRGRKGGVSQHPTPPEVPQHPMGCSGTPPPGCSSTSQVGCPSTPPPGCSDTPPTGLEPSNEAPPPPPLDHGLDQERDHEETHETHGENVFSPSARTRELEAMKARSDELERCGKRMAELGYKLPDKAVMVGAPAWHQFRLLLDRGMAKKAVDHDNGFVMEAIEYIRTFVAPAIEDCPPAFRAQYAAWTKQFNLKLAECRKLGCYVNLWAEEAKVREGRGNYAPVSSSFGQGEVKTGVLSPEDKQAARDRARQRRGERS